MTKEEFEKEYNSAEYRYAQLKQYKNLFDTVERLEYKVKLVQEMGNIHHIDIYKNSNNLIGFYDLSFASQNAIKTIIENDLEDRLNKIKSKIEGIVL